MQQIELALTDPADHLALDEAVLCAADDNELGETMRIWQFADPTVVMGRGSRVNDEIDRSFCHQQQIPVFRRCSGGASIVGGPGCLMYSIVLNLTKHQDLRKIDSAHAYVMQRVLAAVHQQRPQAVLQGICDLTWNNRKCSGNSLKIARHHLLYHGTILYQADLDLLSQCLLQAPRQPEYRVGRDHRSFVTNIPIEPLLMTQSLAVQFNATDTLTESKAIDRLQTRMFRLKKERYTDDAWNYRH